MNDPLFLLVSSPINILNAVSPSYILFILSCFDYYLNLPIIGSFIVIDWTLRSDCKGLEKDWSRVKVCGFTKGGLFTLMELIGPISKVWFSLENCEFLPMVMYNLVISSFSACCLTIKSVLRILYWFTGSSFTDFPLRKRALLVDPSYSV